MEGTFRGILAVIAAAALLVATAAQAQAAGWPSVRDKAMDLREQGRHLDAYKAAISYDSQSSAVMYDRDFVAGWLALRFVRRPDVALGHFKDMAARSNSLRKYEQEAARAKAGYWLGRALRELGRKSDAQGMFAASMAYPTTFYGQLSASELGNPVSKEHVASRAGSYPVKDIYWHDSRAAKEFVLAVIREESRFRQEANSSADARGMMQVLDGTAYYVGKQAGVNVDIGLMRKNADYNIAVGSRYLAEQLDRYGGNPMLAAAAYNAGPQRADEWLQRFGDPRGSRADPVDWAESIPFKETREYVQKVISSYIVYLALRR